MSPWLSELLLHSQSDERLVGLARAGHERAFAAIVERYRGELLGFARRLRADGSAEDLVQQTFLSAFAALRDGADVRHLRGWLYRILRNAATRESTRSEVEPELEAAPLTGEPLEDAVRERMLATEVLGRIAALPGRQRDALVGTALHGRSRVAVAASMGVSEGAVRQLVHRARATLRTAITAVTPWPLAARLAGASSGISGESTAGLVVGAGGASIGGAVFKLGAVLGSALVASGLAAVQLDRHATHRHGGRGPAQPAGSIRSTRPAGDRTGTAAASSGSAADSAALVLAVRHGAPGLPPLARDDRRGRGGGRRSSHDSGTGAGSGGESGEGGSSSSSGSRLAGTDGGGTDGGGGSSSDGGQSSELTATAVSVQTSGSDGGQTSSGSVSSGSSGSSDGGSTSSDGGSGSGTSTSSDGGSDSSTSTTSGGG